MKVVYPKFNKRLGRSALSGRPLFPRASGYSDGMPGNVIILAEVARHLGMLEVKCARCDRHGPLRIDKLPAQHGPETPVGTVMRNPGGRMPAAQRPAGA